MENKTTEENKKNPYVRGYIARQIRECCRYGNFIIPFGEDLEDIIDWIFDNTPSNREFGDKLQEYHNNNKNNLKLFTKAVLSSENRKSILEQKKKEILWNKEISEKKKTEESLKEPVECPKADSDSPFGNPFA